MEQVWQQPWNDCDIRLWNKYDNSYGTVVTMGIKTSIGCVL